MVGELQPELPVDLGLVVGVRRIQDLQQAGQRGDQLPNLLGSKAPVLDAPERLLRSAAARLRSVCASLIQEPNCQMLWIDVSRVGVSRRHYMTLADIYRFPTQHFDFHHGQLTLTTDEP
ncbi:MAG: hypothetical protein GEV10_27355 [Streptosporangiales bacterium]|nr:hypothetical protein [Streptosporangiales bacterium]